MNKFQKITDAIKKANKIAILYHINGDGDAVGSCLALGLALEKLDKSVCIFAEEDVTENLKFLPQSDKITYNNYPNDKFDLAISVDCGDLNRLGNRLDIFNSAKTTINIDHHINNTVNAEINYVDENAAASGEIVYDLLLAAEIEITKDIADCLYAAIVTDCGSFKFQNTSSKVHLIAADLIKNGVNPSEISRLIFDSATFSQLKLLGKTLNEMELFQDNKISMLYLYREDLSENDLSIEDISDIANYGLKVKDVELSVFLREESENLTKVSFRSKNSFDCSSFATLFNGGGHLRAAGCRIKLTLEESKKLILEKLKEIEI